MGMQVWYSTHCDILESVVLAFGREMVAGSVGLEWDSAKQEPIDSLTRDSCPPTYYRSLLSVNPLTLGWSSQPTS